MGHVFVNQVAKGRELPFEVFQMESCCSLQARQNRHKIVFLASLKFELANFC